MNTTKWFIGLSLFSVGVLVGWIVFKEGPRTVHILAEEFRFIPAKVLVKAFQDVRFIVRNQGREHHIFQASFFNNPAVRILWESTTNSFNREPNVSLAVGESVSFIGQFPPGVYAYRCMIKGHRGMEGLLIVRNEALKNTSIADSINFQQLK